MLSKNKSLLIIKLGGSVITDKKTPFTPDVKNIKNLARQIFSIYKKEKTRIIIAHGSGSFGHTMASKYKTHEGIKTKKDLIGMAKTCNAAVQINRIVVEHLLKFGLPAVSFAPGSLLFSSNGKLEAFFSKPINKALALGLVPVVYGDVILDQKRGCTIFSGERVIDILAGSLTRDYLLKKVIYCGDTDGVYNESGETIPLITKKNFRYVRTAIKSSGATDVTGGMIHKVEESLELSKRFKVDVLIVNGKKKDALESERGVTCVRA